MCCDGTPLMKSDGFVTITLGMSTSWQSWRIWGSTVSKVKRVVIPVASAAMLQLRGRVHRIQVHYDCAQAHGRVVGDNVLGAIGHIHANPVSLPHAHFPRALAMRHTLSAQVPESHLGPVEIQGGLVGKISRREY